MCAVGFDFGLLGANLNHVKLLVLTLDYSGCVVGVAFVRSLLGFTLERCGVLYEFYPVVGKQWVSFQKVRAILGHVALTCILCSTFHTRRQFGVCISPSVLLSLHHEHLRNP